MQKMIEGFRITKDGATLDEFRFIISSNNHATINNNSHCLFDGYSLEAFDKWAEVKHDMDAFRLIGCKIERM